MTWHDPYIGEETPDSFALVEHWAFQVETPFRPVHEIMEAFSPSTERLTFEGETAYTGSPEQVAFREKVLRAHLAHSKANKGLPGRDLAPSELEPVAGTTIMMRRDAAEAAGRMIVAANAALAKAGASGHPDAQRTTRITAASGYRGSQRQAAIWRKNFEGYYLRSSRHRGTLPSGPHGDEATRYMITGFRVPRWTAAPGYSNHQAGIAIDLLQKRSSGHIRNSSHADALKAWRRTWLYEWLSKNAASFGYHPYEKEPWHWEYRPSFGPATAAGSTGRRQYGPPPPGPMRETPGYEATREVPESDGFDAEDSESEDPELDGFDAEDSESEDPELDAKGAEDDGYFQGANSFDAVGTDGRHVVREVEQGSSVPFLEKESFDQFVSEADGSTAVNLDGAPFSGTTGRDTESVGSSGQGTSKVPDEEDGYSQEGEPSGRVNVDFEFATVVGAAEVGLAAISVVQAAYTSASLNINYPLVKRQLLNEARQLMPGTVKGKKAYKGVLFGLGVSANRLNAANAVITIEWEGNDYGEITTPVIRKDIFQSSGWSASSATINIILVERIPEPYSDPRGWPIFYSYEGRYDPWGNGDFEFQGEFSINAFGSLKFTRAHKVVSRSAFDFAIIGKPENFVRRGPDREAAIPVIPQDQMKFLRTRLP